MDFSNFSVSCSLSSKDAIDPKVKIESQEKQDRSSGLKVGFSLSYKSSKSLDTRLDQISFDITSKQTGHLILRGERPHDDFISMPN